MCSPSCPPSAARDLPRRARVPSASDTGAGAEEPLLGIMGFDPVDVDSLCARAGLPAERVSAELLRLELAGRVAALPGGRYQRLN